MLALDVNVQGFGFNCERGLSVCTILTSEEKMTSMLLSEKFIHVLVPDIVETHKLSCSPNNIRFFVTNMLNDHIMSRYFSIEAKITTVNET